MQSFYPLAPHWQPLLQCVLSLTLTQSALACTQLSLLSTSVSAVAGLSVELPAAVLASVLAALSPPQVDSSNTLQQQPKPGE